MLARASSKAGEEVGSDGQGGMKWEPGQMKTPLGKRLKDVLGGGSRWGEWTPANPVAYLEWPRGNGPLRTST